jgi:prepilin-type N-terminal cleavage/methylation domain-containing protein
MSKLSGKRRRGFTIVELLVVIAIIGILAGLLLPAVQKIREAANRTYCANNLHQIGLACLAYESDYKCLPPTYNINQGASWMVTVLPYLEQNDLYNQWDMTKTYYQQSDKARLTQVQVYFCPTRRSPLDVRAGSVAGDFSSSNLDMDTFTPGQGVFTNIPGALSDYAGSIGLADT